MTRKLRLHFYPANLPAASRWYAVARSQARSFARLYGCTYRCAAGIIAALSPRCSWSDNIRAAECVLSGKGKPRALGINVAKARRILAGEAPLTVLSGPKVRAFYRAIVGDSSAVVVDTWIARAAGVRGALTPRRYSRIERAVGRLARELNLDLAVLQAAIWIGIRGSAA